MEFTSILFYVFSLFFVGSSFVMITSRNTAKAALWLILTFFSAASLWLLLEAEFLAITLILIYVGAVMVLFMFVIKMLDTEESTLRAQFTRYLPLGIFVSLVVIVQMALVLNAGPFDLESVGMPEQHGASYSNITAIAQQLYTVYVYPFELAAILLLIAIIAAITLVHRTQVNSKKQNITEQINVQAKDRMRFASINKKSEKGVQMIALSDYLILSSIVFCIGLAGIFINRTNIIMILMCVELILAAVNTNFIAFSFYGSDLAGQIFVFFILTVAAAEVAIGLAILTLMYRNRGSIDIDVTNTLKG